MSLLTADKIVYKIKQVIIYAIKNIVNSFFFIKTFFFVFFCIYQQ